jgi:hypothetical protein
MPRPSGPSDRRPANVPPDEEVATARSKSNSSHAPGPLRGPKPEPMTVPRGATRSNRRAHPSRLGWARGFLPSWSCEFNSRHPLDCGVPNGTAIAAARPTVPWPKVSKAACARPAGRPAVRSRLPRRWPGRGWLGQAPRGGVGVYRDHGRCLGGHLVRALHEVKTNRPRSQNGIKPHPIDLPSRISDAAEAAWRVTLSPGGRPADPVTIGLAR